jgi:hypothetical protein
MALTRRQRLVSEHLPIKKLFEDHLPEYELPTMRQALKRDCMGVR